MARPVWALKSEVGGGSGSDGHGGQAIGAQMHGGPMQMLRQRAHHPYSMCPSLAAGPAANRAAPQLLH